MPKRTPEQIARAKERSRREATFPKCPCGNVAGVGETYCGHCRPAVEARLERRSQFDDMRANVNMGLPHLAVLAIIDMLEEQYNG